VAIVAMTAATVARTDTMIGVTGAMTAATDAPDPGCCDGADGPVTS